MTLATRSPSVCNGFGVYVRQCRFGFSLELRHSPRTGNCTNRQEFAWANRRRRRSRPSRYRRATAPRFDSNRVAYFHSHLHSTTTRFPRPSGCASVGSSSEFRRAIDSSMTRRDSEVFKHEGGLKKRSSTHSTQQDAGPYSVLFYQTRDGSTQVDCECRWE